MQYVTPKTKDLSLPKRFKRDSRFLAMPPFRSENEICLYGLGNETILLCELFSSLPTLAKLIKDI